MTAPAPRLEETPTPAAIDRVKRVLPADAEGLVVAVAELLDAAVRQMREERDAAIEALAVLITDVRSDTAANTARLDRLDPPGSTPLPGYCTLKQAAFASNFSDETVRQWARAGEVASTKTGVRVWVELASVMERAGRRG
jgi:hypothetical protein